MEYETAGDRMSGLKWSRRTTRKIAAELGKEGIVVSDKTVGRLLKGLGFSMQANRKRIALSGNGTKEKREARDRQFNHICRMRMLFARRNEPVISVDTKKKELIGEFKNAGRVWRNRPRAVADHDFPSYASAKVAPYGVYDTIANKGNVSLGTSHDTAAFAADSICTWWAAHGAKSYPDARRILILADSGGSNAPTNKAWKYHLWSGLCQGRGLTVTVCHYPAGASKWNPIEHRLFSEISKNWAGEPLNNIETALKFIRTTKTAAGLRVTAKLNSKSYPTREKISEGNLSMMRIKCHKNEPNLNYELRPSN